MIFREIGKSKRDAGVDAASDMLKKGEYGVLSTTGDDGYPYGVPLSYVYFDAAIYFHCAQKGHKIDNMLYNDKVSFCVVGEVAAVPEKFTTRYKSTIAFGRAVEVFEKEKEEVLKKLVEKYSKNYSYEGDVYIKRESSNARVFKIEIEHLTGKQRI